jgi:hypothetical protein
MFCWPTFGDSFNEGKNHQCFYNRIGYFNRLQAVEADECQVSRPLRGLQWLHSNCLCVQHDQGDLARYNPDVGREMAAMGHEARI